MLIEKFLGYREGAAIETIPPQYLTYPSKNCIIYKGVVQTRGGTTNDGTATTENSPITGEFVWTDAKSGRQAMRTYGENLQVKLNDIWVTIYSGLAADATRVRFATWTDGNGAVIKKRCFFVDGGTSIHEWNGAVGEVASYNAGTFTATLDSAAASGLLRGFDAGTLTALVIRFDTDGSLLGIEEKTYTNDCTSNTIVFSGALTDAPQAGDLIVAKPIANSVLTSFEKDDIFTFPVTNHLVVTSLSSGEIYGSDSVTKLDFTVPAAINRTAASAFFLTLPGNIQATVSRSKGNSESQPETIWFSTEDSWYKVSPLSAASTITGHWFEIQALELPPRSGSLPFMTANYKGDIVFLSQDKRLQRIQTLELVGRDELSLLSDEVEGLLGRLDFTGGNIYYDARYIWITAPADTHLLLLDMVGDPERGLQQFWNPPQITSVSHISVIDGVRYGHSSVDNQTFELFNGPDDLGIDISATIALGTIASRETFLRYLTHESIGISGKKTPTTTATVAQSFESEAAKASDTFDLSDIKTYTVADDTSYASVPWASRATGDLETVDVERFFCFAKNPAISYFEHRIVLTISGEAISFHLHGIETDLTSSQEQLGEDLFISR
jgi:hypothetical protein